MDQATKLMIQKWIVMHNGDTEAVAKWMTRNLNMAGLKVCRELVKQATQ